MKQPFSKPVTNTVLVPWSFLSMHGNEEIIGAPSSEVALIEGEHRFGG